MARRKATGGGAAHDERPTYLAAGFTSAVVAAALDDRIAKGRELLARVDVNVFPQPGHFDELDREHSAWHNYNATYLERAFTTKELRKEFEGVFFGIIGSRRTDLDRIRELAQALQRDISKLVDIQGRLPLYEPAKADTAPAGIAAASVVLRQMTEAVSTQLTPTEVAHRWAAAHVHFLEVVFARFDADGNWPALEDLQRRLDREGDEIDLLAGVRTLPKELAFRDLATSRIILKVRALAFVPAAKPLLNACIRVVQLAVGRYLAADGTPRLTASDLPDELGLDGTTSRKVSALLDNEPMIFGGGTGRLTDPTWERDLLPSIRAMRGVDSVETYLEVQARALDEPLPYVPAIPRRALKTTEPADSSAAGAAGESATTRPALVLRLEDLHPIIRDACASRFASRHYADGVQQAAIALRDLVRQRSGLRLLDGVDLMSQALSPNEPILVVADLKGKTGQSVQLGTMQLAQGAMAALRNPVAHERLDLGPSEAMAMVATLSLLASRVELAKRSRRKHATQPKPPHQ